MKEQIEKKTNMGLTNFRGEKVRKQDVSIAKNYLSESELLALNNLVEQYLVFATGQAMRRIPMYMKDWIEKLHGFLTLNDRNILTHTGKISHELALEHAEKEYEEFNQIRIQEISKVETDFDRAIATEKSRKKEKKKSKKKWNRIINLNEDNAWKPMKTMNFEQHIFQKINPRTIEKTQYLPLMKEIYDLAIQNAVLSR